MERHLRDNGIPNDSRSIQRFSSEVVRRITHRVIEGSNLESGDINALASLNTGEYIDRTKAGRMDPDALFVSRKKAGAGLGGFTVPNVKMLNPTPEAQTAANELNVWVNRVVKNSNGYVSKKTDWFMASESNVEAIMKEIKNARVATDLKAQEMMHTFLNGLDPKDPLRKASIKHLNDNPDNAQTMLKWMAQMGVIKHGVKTLDGTISPTRFGWNGKLWTSEKFQKEWLKKVDMFGANIKNI